MEDADKHIILISGTGRSGTNITKSILSKHSNVYSLPFESRFAIDPSGIIDTYITIKNSWSPYIVDTKISNLIKYLKRLGKRNFFQYNFGKFIKFIDKKGLLFTPPPYFEWELSKWFPNYYQHVFLLFDELIDFQYNAVWPGANSYQYKNKMKFISYNKSIDQVFTKFFESLFCELLNYNNKTHFVEDNTWSILFVKEIFEIIPNSKLIHIYRDPRDVIVSLMSQRWAPSDLDQCINYYSSIVSKIIGKREKIPNEKILDISIENLVKSPEYNIRQICKFCELEFSGELLKTDISKSNAGRWRDELSKFDQEKLNKSIKPYLDYFGYDT